MRILITGASGFIGTNLINILKNTNNQILGVYCKNEPKISKKKNLKFIKHDLKLKKNNTIKKFKPELVIHLAWNDIPNFSKKKSFENLHISKIFFNFIFDLNSCKKIIVSGSSFEKNKSIKNKYFINSKKLLYKWLKNQCLKNEIDLGWFRIFYVFGPLQRKKSLIPYLLNSLEKNKKPKIKNLYMTNDFIFVEDVAKMFKESINKKLDYKQYDIGTGKLTSVWKVCNLLEKIVLKKNIYFKINKNAKYKKNHSASLENFKKNICHFSFSNIKDSLRKTAKYYSLNDNY